MADEKYKFLKLTTMTYADQSKWYLNGFWNDGAKEAAEQVWSYTAKFIELDINKKKDGNELDEFMAHKFLESLGETLTVIQLREKLRKIDLDCNGKMALLEYLAFKYGKTVSQILNAPQGDNQDEVNEAQSKLRAVMDSFEEVRVQLQQQTVALAEQEKAEESAQAALIAAKKAEEVVRKAEAELKSAVDDLKAQEDSYQEQLRTLDAKSKDGASTVAKSKAAAELAQLKQENPLPLRKAKITQEAALRKVERERKVAEQATASSEESKRKAEEKTQALLQQKEKVEEAVRDMENRVKEATDFLEEVKRKGGVPLGSIWWVERELKEAQKYMPKKKQTL